MRRLAPAAFLLLCSAGFSFVALGLPDSEPFTFLALRYAIVVALLALAIPVVRPPLPGSGRDWIDLAIVGLLLQAGYFSLLYVALDLEASTRTIALIVSLQPILVALLAPRVAGERVGARRWAGLGIGLAGATVVIASRSSVGSLSTAGLLCATGALLALTASTLYETRFGSEHQNRSSAGAAAARLEVDHQRHALQAVAVAQAVLEEVGVVARHLAAVVDLHGESRRARLELGHVVHAQPLAAHCRRLALALEVAQEAVQLGRGDPLGGAVGQGQRLRHQSLEPAPGRGRHRQ
jgi:uncharacterized membrane protein